MSQPRRTERPNRIPKANLDAHRQGSFSNTTNFKANLESYKNEKVVFSWRYFRGDHEAFNCGGVDKSWFMDLMNQLKNVSDMKLVDYHLSVGKPLRVHKHDWNRVAFKYDHLSSEQLTQIEDDTTQFSISTARGRVHGFMIENLFFVVFLDPDHNMYPRNGPVYHDPPLSSYEILENEILDLKRSLEEAKKENIELEEQLYVYWEKEDKDIDPAS